MSARSPIERSDSAPQHTHDAAPADLGVHLVEAELREETSNHCCRAVHIEAQFGLTVHSVPPRTHLLDQFGRHHPHAGEASAAPERGSS
jgi:hypothetical protein